MEKILVDKFIRGFMFVVVLFVTTSCMNYKVYSVKDRPALPVSGGVVYALPRTELQVTLTVERRDLSKAPYNEFATELLGLESIDTDFHLANIDVKGVSVADPDQYFFVKVRRGSVTVTPEHLLLSVGMPIDGSRGAESGERKTENGVRRAESAEYNLYDRTDTLYTRYDSPGHPSYVSTRKDSRNKRQRATAAAEELDELHSKKQELTGGEYNGNYNNETLRYIYEQLSQREREIVAEFCGETESEDVTYYVTPRFGKEGVFCDTIVWFSPSEGLVGDADQLPDDAFPVVCMVEGDSELRSTSRFVKYHTTGWSSGKRKAQSAKRRAESRKCFRYRIPEKSIVTVTTPDFTVRRQIEMSQLGPVVALPGRRIKATFDTQTFNLLMLERE